MGTPAGQMVFNIQNGNVGNEINFLCACFIMEKEVVLYINLFGTKSIVHFQTRCRLKFFLKILAQISITS